MVETQPIEAIEAGALTGRVEDLKRQGYRLVQICCTKGDGYVVDYSFDKDYAFLGLRLTVPFEKPEMPSISSVYWAAFPYENEIQDLFGIRPLGLVLDYKGSFYRLSKKTPFAAEATVTGEPAK